jgi:hypothetical protein
LVLFDLINHFNPKGKNMQFFKAVVICFLLCLVLFINENSFAGTVYVDSAAAGSNNGTSWGNAYASLQSALGAAIHGDQIWVARGTYKPTTGTDRAISFKMVVGVNMYGGFNGTETVYSQRDWKRNVSILSGDIGVVGDSSDNSYTVVKGADSATIDGFTITYGYADSNAYKINICGGGMTNYKVSPIVRNCIFTKNTTYSFGGGMYNNNCKPRIEDCTFSFNVSTNGDAGGMFIDDVPTEIFNCVFDHNCASSEGGGICIYNTSYPQSASTTLLSNCTFRNNIANEGGGMYVTCPTAIVKISGCDFVDNYAELDGGGLVADCLCSLTVTNSIITNNTADGYCWVDEGNTYYYGGGGMAIFESYVNLSNCTIVKNKSMYGGALSTGVGINNRPTRLLMQNSILYDNKADSLGNEIFNGDSTRSVLSYTDIKGGVGNIINYGGSTTKDSIGNINSDPLFIDTSNIYGPDGNLFSSDDGLRLQAASPCIDAGDPASSFSNEPQPNGSRINMGAYGNTSLATASTANQLTISASTPSYYYFGSTHLGINFLNLTGADSVAVTVYPDSFPPNLIGWNTVKRFYHITAGPGITNFKAVVTLYYTQAEFDSSDIANEASLYCARYDGSSWTSLFNSVVDINANAVSCTTTQFSTWAIAGEGAPVPVILSSFTAQTKSGNIELAWVTQSEQLNLGWNILRSASADGQFTQINPSLVPGAGSAVTLHSYSYTDAATKAGNTYYYKLEQIGTNGSKEYSAVISASMDMTSITASTITRGTGVLNGTHQAMLYNMSGKKVPIDNAGSGIYILKDDKGAAIRKVLIIK